MSVVHLVRAEPSRHGRDGSMRGHFSGAGCQDAGADLLGRQLQASLARVEKLRSRVGGLESLEPDVLHASHLRHRFSVLRQRG